MVLPSFAANKLSMIILMSLNRQRKSNVSEKQIDEVKINILRTQEIDIKFVILMP